MKKIIQSATVLLLLTMLNAQFSIVFAQGTAFTYQGRLNDSGSRADGNYDLTFAVFSDSNGVNQIGGTVTNTAVAINNGLFTVELDFGPGIFTGAPLWLQIGAETNGGGGVFTLLTPLQQLTPTPYAIYTSSAGSAFSANVASSAMSASFASTAATANGVAAGSVSGAGIAGNSVVKSLNSLQDSVTLSPGANISITPSGNTLTIAASSTILSSSSNAWSLAGNAGTSPTLGNFLGTTDDQPLELHVGGIRAFRLEPGFSGTPNVVGGLGSTVAPSSDGETIAGGYQNRASGDYSAIGGGYANHVTNNYATVAGGNGNTASGDYSTVGGGQGNHASGLTATLGGGDGNNVTNDYATIAGGYGNTAGGNASTVGGGLGNLASGLYATIGGGFQNYATNNAMVGGGDDNRATGPDSFAGGGSGNQATGTGSFVGGGGFDGTATYGNTASGTASTLGGGMKNQDSVTRSFVGGGGCDGSGYSGNTAGGAASAVAGGFGNQASGPYAAVPGGYQNSAAGQSSFAAGQYATANVNNSFVWGDGTRYAVSPGPDTFTVLATGGAYFYTTTSGANVEVDNNGNLVDNSGDLDFGTTTRQMINLYSSTYGIGVQANDEYFRTAGQYYWYLNGSHNNANGNSGGGSTMMSLTTSGLTVNGTFVSASDRNLKEHFQAVDGRQVLAQVSALPITRWNYKEDTSSQHIGPMAQDFYAAFGVGPDDKHITTIDEGGIALAAIQGLNERVNEKDIRIQEQAGEIAELKQSVEDLKKIVQSLAEKK